MKRQQTKDINIRLNKITKKCLHMIQNVMNKTGDLNQQFLWNQSTIFYNWVGQRL